MGVISFIELEEDKIIYCNLRKRVIYYTDSYDRIQCKPLAEVIPLYNINLDVVNQRFMDFMTSAGYESLNQFVLDARLEKYVGMTFKEFKHIITKLGHDAQKARSLRNEKACCESPVPGKVLMLSKQFDMYNTGFNVYLIMNSYMSFEEIKDTLILHKKDIMQYVCEEVLKNKRLMKRIGDLSYYRIYKMVITRQHEIHFMFDLKCDNSYLNSIDKKEVH